MLPTVLILGLVLGRWWVLTAAAIVWPVLLLTTVPLDQLGASDLALGSALAVANAAVGVAVHKAALLPFRRHVP